jgi:hypothetical protein
MDQNIDTAENAAELPDIYAPAAQLLALLNVGNRALFSRQNDPLPCALAELIDYDTETVKRMMAVQDSASMYDILDEDPFLFLNHLVLGQLVYASPLGHSLTTLFVPEGSADAHALAQQRDEIRAYVAHTVEWYEPVIETAFLVERYPEDQQAEVRQERAELRAAVAAAFAEWQHSLGSMLLPAPAPVVPMPGHGWSLLPMRLQLDTLAMTATILRLLPGLSSHAFAQAAARLPDFHPQRLEELGDYLHAATADERLTLRREQGMLLYVSTHLVIMLFIHDILDGGGLDDLLLQSSKQQAAYGDELAAMVSKLREVTALILGGYIEVVRENEGDAADFQALEARLGPVLALASS